MSVVDPIEEIEEQAIADSQKRDKWDEWTKDPISHVSNKLAEELRDNIDQKILESLGVPSILSNPDEIEERAIADVQREESLGKMRGSGLVFAPYIMVDSTVVINGHVDVEKYAKAKYACVEHPIWPEKFIISQ